MSDVYVEFECEECGHTEVCDTQLVHGPTENEDEHIVLDPPEACRECGGEVTEHWVGGGSSCRDEGREDFHADG